MYVCVVIPIVCSFSVQIQCGKVFGPHHVMKRGLRCWSSIQSQIFPQCTVVEFHFFLAGLQHSAIQEISPSKQTRISAAFLSLTSQFASSALITSFDVLCRQSLPLKWQLRRFSARRAVIVCLTYCLTVNHVVVRDFNWMHRCNEAIKNKSIENKLNKQTIYPHYKLVIPLVCPCLPQNATALATASYSGYSDSKASSGENQVTHSPSTHKHNSFPGLMRTFLQCGHLGSSLHPRPLYTRP